MSYRCTYSSDVGLCNVYISWYCQKDDHWEKKDRTCQQLVIGVYSCTYPESPWVEFHSVSFFSLCVYISFEWWYFINVTWFSESKGSVCLMQTYQIRPSHFLLFRRHFMLLIRGKRSTTHCLRYLWYEGKRVCLHKSSQRH